VAGAGESGVREVEVGMAGVAGLYGQMGDYDRALALCSEILEKEPDLYSALYNCGNIHLMDGQYKERNNYCRARCS